MTVQRYLEIKYAICTEKNDMYDESGCEHCEICSYEDDEPKVAIEMVQDYGKIVDPNTDNIVKYLKRKKVVCDYTMKNCENRCLGCKVCDEENSNVNDAVEVVNAKFKAIINLSKQLSLLDLLIDGYGISYLYEIISKWYSSERPYLKFAEYAKSVPMQRSIFYYRKKVDESTDDGLYDKYCLSWLIEHGYLFSDIEKLVLEWVNFVEAEEEFITFQKYVETYGFNKEFECYVCFSEFLTNGRKLEASSEGSFV